MIQRLWIVGSAVAIFVSSAWPQSEVELRLATGPPEGTYHIIGKAISYAIDSSTPSLRIKPLSTNGSVENLNLLEQGKVHLALAQNDVIAEMSRRLNQLKRKLPWQSILVLTQEPVQIIAGAALHGDTLESLSGHPLSLGVKGSGTYFTAAEVLKTLGIKPFSEVPVRSVDEVAGMLRQGRSHAGFFVGNVPSPLIAALLADPSFRLLTFQTREIDRLHSVLPYYATVTIPEHTYPRQNYPVTTMGVLTVLLCRTDLGSEIVEQITTTLLHDVASPASFLRRFQAGVNLSTILQFTKRTVVPLHPGAQRALHTIPPSMRMQAYLDWIRWALWVSLACLTLAFAWLRPLRLLMASLLSSIQPAGIAHVMRVLLFHYLLWRVVRILSLLVLIWLFGSALMYLCEREVNVNFVTLKQSCLSILVYLFSGLEDRAPVTSEGWIGSVIMLVAGLLVAAYITGSFASEILLHTSGVIQMTKNASKRGFLVVGWNPRAERVIHELFQAFESGLPYQSITVLTEERVDTSRSKEFESQGVTFVSGNTFDKKLLERIGAHQANSVIILADDESEDPDAKTALTILGLRSLCRERGIPDDRRPHICAEVINHRKIELIKDAGADEVVCHEDFGLGVLAQSAFAAKITQVYDELLTYSEDTCEVYMLKSPCEENQRDIPKDLWEILFEGKTFAEAAEVFNRYRDDENPAILIGVRRGDQLLLNPRHQLRLQAGDELLVIAWQRPRLERWRPLLPSKNKEAAGEVKPVSG